MKTGLLIFIFLCSSLSGQTAPAEFPVLKGPYLGQKAPGKIPEPFAPEIMTAEMGYHSSIVFSPDLKEAFWRPMDGNEGKILYANMGDDGRWTRPGWTDFGMGDKILDPIFSVDGQRLYFLSFKPDADGRNKRERIWFVEKTGNGWSKPVPIGKVISDHPTHWTFSLASNGNLYFTSECKEARGEQDIYLARYEGGEYRPPVSLGPAVNSDGRDFTPFIAPDESYLIFARMGPETGGKTDLYISYKTADGSWTRALNMGPEVNSTAYDLAPYVDPSGKYLFFISQRDKLNGIMWMSASIIDELKNEK